MARKSKEERLMAHCQKFIKTHDINCPETIYQSDRVIENAYEFIEGVCKIVGYAEIDDD